MQLRRNPFAEQRRIAERLAPLAGFARRAVARRAVVWLAYCLTGLLAVGGLRVHGAEPIKFDDVTSSSGLAAHLEGDAATRPWRYAHGAAWGDVDGDGRPDLFLGAFASRSYYREPRAPSPNRLFLNKGERFEPAADATLEAREANARCAGAVFADLDNDGDLDLIVTNHMQHAHHGSSKLFENLGLGRFRDATPERSPWTDTLGLRNVGAMDVDGDGRLDLLLTDGSYGREASARARLLVMRNQGAFEFEEFSQRLGLPAGETTGLGLALGDINNDGLIDIFVAGSSRLFVTQASGGFREVVNPALQYPTLDRREGLRCGAAMADLDGDDRLDLVVTEHGVPTRLHIFHNRGVRDGTPDLVEVSESTGAGDVFPVRTKQMPLKTAHVALRDVDNDGRVDMMLSVVTRDAHGVIQPVVLRNLCERRGEIRFSRPPFDTMYSYFAPGPVADFDRDGRVDVMLPSWIEALPNCLFRNTTPGGRWLTVQVRGAGPKHNRQGVGAIVRAYAAGHVGDAGRLLARTDIVVGVGYASGEEALAHLGLGATTRVDLRIDWGARCLERRDVPTDQFLTIDFPD